MSAEVVFNEVWTEDHNPLPPCHLLSHSFIFPPSRPWRRLKQTELQRRAASHKSTGAGWGGRKVMVELMGENEVSFFSPLFHYSIPPSIIMWSQQEQITEPVRDTLKIFFQAAAGVKLFCVSVRGNVCVIGCNVLILCVSFVFVEAGQDGCASSPPLARSMPTPTHNNPPQNYGFVVEHQPAVLMHFKFARLRVNVSACLPARWDPTDEQHISNMPLIWMKGSIFIRAK